MKKIVVWYNPNKNIYYYRIVRGLFYERYDYKEGSVNNYGHIICNTKNMIMFSTLLYV